MFRFAQVCTIVLLALAPTAAFAGPSEEARALIDRWAATYSSNDADAVVKLYAPDAILLGTVSPVINEGSAAIAGYFARLPAPATRSRLANGAWWC